MVFFLLVMGGVNHPRPAVAAAVEDPWEIRLATMSGEVELIALRDKPLVLSFFFTSCAVACPAQTAKLARVQRDLPTSVKEGSRFVSISIDPARDTHRRIADYATSFGADMNHWTFAKAQDHEALGNLTDFLDLEIKPGRYGQLDHAMVVYLIRPDGEVVQRYVGHEFQELQLVQDLVHVVHPRERR